MSPTMHPAAPHHLPFYITAPGETDALMVGSVIFLILAILGLGSVYFRLHSLPEKLAHGNASKVQFEVVAVLALLALFTHNNWFWVGALILALVPIPDMHGPLARMADALTRMASRGRSGDLEPAAAEPLSAVPTALAEVPARDLNLPPDGGKPGEPAPPTAVHA